MLKARKLFTESENRPPFSIHFFDSTQCDIGLLRCPLQWMVLCWIWAEIARSERRTDETLAFIMTKTQSDDVFGEICPEELSVVLVRPNYIHLSWTWGWSVWHQMPHEPGDKGPVIVCHAGSLCSAQIISECNIWMADPSQCENWPQCSHKHLLPGAQDIKCRGCDWWRGGILASDWMTGISMQDSDNNILTRIKYHNMFTLVAARPFKYWLLNPCQ